MSCLTLNGFRSLPDVRQVEWLANASDHDWLIRLHPDVGPRTLADHLVDLANAEGGIICLGIDGVIVQGVARSSYRVASWRSAAANFTAPIVRHDFAIRGCRTSRGQDDHLILIDVVASDRRHHNVANESTLDVLSRLGSIE